MPAMGGIGPFSRRLRDRQDEPLPLPAGPVSNGEFVPASATGHDRAVNACIRRSLEDSARTARHGPPAFPPGRRRRRGVTRRVRACRLLDGRRRHAVGSGTRRQVHGATTHRCTRLPACAAGIRIRRGRPHPSRDPERSLGAELPGDRSRRCSPCCRRAARTRHRSTASTGPTTSTTSFWPATRRSRS